MNKLNPEMLMTEQDDSYDVEDFSSEEYGSEEDQDLG